MQANEKTIIGVDHGYAAIKTAHCVFPTGLTAYNHEPYTRQDVLEYEGKWYVCGTGRQPVQREKMANDTYDASGQWLRQCGDLPEPGAGHDPVSG